MKRFWTDDILEWIHSGVLPDATTLEQVVEKVKLRHGRRMTVRSLSEAFTKKYGYAPGSRLNISSAASVTQTPELSPAENPVFLKKRITQLESDLKQANTRSDIARLVQSMLHAETQHENESPRWSVVKSKHKPKHGTPVLFLSDTHCGETVFTNEVNGANSYNMDIARTRIRRVFERSIFMLDEVLSPSPYDCIWLPLGGDIVSGNIHEELRETNTAPIFDIVLETADILERGIELLLNRFGAVNIPCITGNHGRLDKKPRMKHGPQDNYEYILYHILKRRFANDPRVTIQVSDSFTVRYEINGVRFLLTHGDQFKGGNGIAGPATPWALGEHKLRKQMCSIESWTGEAHEYDILMFGHFHSLNFMRNMITNGSVVGFSEYAKKMNLPFEPPQQALFLVTEDRGVTMPMAIFAEDPPSRKK